MQSIYPGVKKKFDLEKVDEAFFMYKRLGRLKEINEIKGRATISTTSDKRETITGFYSADVDYENGAAKIQISCILDDEKWYITGFQVSSTLWNDLEPKADSPDPDQEKQTADARALEAQVSQLLDSKDTVAIRHNIEKLYALASIYETEGKEEQLIGLLEKILEMDAGNLAGQMKLAELLVKHANRDDAQKRALSVYTYTEDKALFNRAKAFLKTHDFLIPPRPVPADIETGIEIVMVPMGNVNMQVLYELQVLLQERMGIRISLMDRVVDTGPPDRMGLVPYLKNFYEKIRHSMSRLQSQSILDWFGMNQEISNSPDEQQRFIWKYFSLLGEKGEMYRRQFSQELKQQENEGQFLAHNMIERLRKAVPFGENKMIKGYLGVTSQGLYCPNCNFLFGSSEFAYGVISYNQFLAVYNNEGENRQRLVRRLLKQALSTSNFLLGINRCNTPYCARAYPHSLQEHDAKSDSLCPVCLSRLTALKNGNVFGHCAASLREQGDDYRDMGELQIAEMFYQRALEENPGNAYVWSSRGDVYAMQGQWAQAVSAFQKAHELAPDHDGFMLHVAINQIKNRQFENALDSLAGLLDKNPDNLKALKWTAMCYTEMKKTKMAVPYLEKAIAVDPAYKDPYRLLAGCFNAIGEPDRATSVLEKMIRQFPNDYLGYYYLARQCVDTDAPRSAENLKKTIALNPGLVEAYQLLGVNLARSGKHEEALKIFKQGIAIAPENDNLFNSLGYTYYKKKAYSQAVTAYEKALKINPDNGLCHYNKALAHYALGQFKLAKQHVDTARDVGYKGSDRFRQAVYRAAGAG